MEERVIIEPDNPSIERIESLCIHCGTCAKTCHQQISVHGCYDINASKTGICIHCGQCILTCPKKSLVEKKEWHQVQAAIDDPTKTVVFMTSPSVRVAFGEVYGKKPGDYEQTKTVGALRMLGADTVFDTTFAADMTIMEEASELIDRITNKKPLPQFTSCCPAWVKFAETYYPQLIPNISTSKSPIGMFGPTVKSYYAKKAGIDPLNIVTVALTPCTAKKFEIRREEMNAAGKKIGHPEMRDTDYVIDTRELGEWLKSRGIKFEEIEDSDYDPLMPQGSGAGVIFGNTGGVMEAALRTAYWMLEQKNPPAELLHYEPVRGQEGIKEASLTIAGIPVKVAVVFGTNNARRLIESGIDSYTFIEVMTCPGGCIGGGGQPLHLDEDAKAIRQQRIDGLYQKDDKCTIRYSHENPELQELYQEQYGKPLSEYAEEFLHTFYHDRSADLGEDPKKYAKPVEAPSQKWRCIMCGYIYEGDLTKEPDDWTCPVCGVGKDMFEKIEG